ncbi:probable ATP-dependent RNA helicase spindle-E [Prorops nasuta]|uniref:probable ATP-dependent RNA helicase spindle-E n=1 Tax=Prorops nasuta TaxID=863751 RepID=UPI0034CE82C5
MDIFDFFNGNSEKIIIPSTSRKRVIINDDNENAEKERQLLAQAKAEEDTNANYAKEYIEHEEKMLLQSGQFIQSMADFKLDEISVGTAPPIDDVHAEDLNKLYKTYKFDHRPQNNLTIASKREEIVSMIETNSVVIIDGRTGCGKTTQVPQFILDHCYQQRKHCNIIVTQPRRIAAISIAKRVSQERNWPCGSLVGYQVGMSNVTSRDTRLTYCTTGVLLHKLINRKNMLDFTHVILDEVHERDQEMDFLLIVVRRLLRTNSRAVKVILMSATFNIEKFANYFSSPLGNKLVPAPTVDIAKENRFSTTPFYLCQLASLGKIPDVCPEKPTVSSNLMNFCLQLIKIFDEIDMKTMMGSDPEACITNYERHVVLIFLPGIHEIEEFYELLVQPDNEKLNWDIVALHSTITNEDQQKIFFKPPAGYRRLILSTNIAESSITVPDVKYVIDFCLTKLLVTNPINNFQSLQLTWASKTNCVQRAGRAGRVMEGRVYRLIPKYLYDNLLPEDVEPEILRAPLETLVLQAKMLDMGPPKAILALAIDPPSLKNLKRTILRLKEAGALLNRTDDMGHYDGELTDLGRIMANLPLDIKVAKMIVLGHVFSVLRDSIIIGASMAVRNMFDNPFQKKLLAYKIKFSYAQKSCSDGVSFLNIYKIWRNEKGQSRFKNHTTEKNWARRHFVQIRVLREVEELVKDLTKRLEMIGITETFGRHKVVWNDEERKFILKVVFAGAFYPNYFLKKAASEIQEDGSSKIVYGLDPLKTVYLTGWPSNQPGYLYAKRIQAMFSDLIDPLREKIVLKFNQSRVYVHFSQIESYPNSHSANSKISDSMYLALKLRHNNTPIIIDVLDEYSANKYAKEIGLIKEYDLFQPSNQQVNNLALSNILPRLPPFNVSIIDIIITRIITPGSFWVQVKSKRYHDTMKEIDIRIAELIESQENFENPPPLKTLVLAPRNTKDKVQYYRATIEGYSLDEGQASAGVQFIDSGHHETIPISRLVKIPNSNKLREIPALAMKCELALVRPGIDRMFRDDWGEEALEMLSSLIKPTATLIGKIYSVVNGVIRIELMHKSKDNNTLISFNKTLVDKGYALAKEEEYLSRYNHNLRLQHEMLKEDERNALEKFQYDETNFITDYPNPPKLEDCTKKIQLRGPFSPLEVEFRHQAIMSQGKKVRIESESVNSVILDPEPTDRHDRLLVSSCVNENITGAQLSLRNTSLLPNFPGLPAILTLIFTPCIELRRNIRGTNYIGALCGLGYDPRTKESLYPEHDVEVRFDTEITMEDLENINKLRHWMNTGIRLNDGNSEIDHAEQIINCQSRVKAVLEKLLYKTRKSQEFDTVDNFSKWGIYDESLFLVPGKENAVRNNIYNLHYALELENRDDKAEMMEDHLADLRKLAGGRDRDVPDLIECKLCNASVFGLMQLRAHLFSQDHRTKVELLKM